MVIIIIISFIIVVRLFMLIIAMIMIMSLILILIQRLQVCWGIAQWDVSYLVNDLVHRVWPSSQLPTGIAVTEDVLRVGNLSCPDTRSAMAAAVVGAGAHCRFLRWRSE